MIEIAVAYVGAYLGRKALKLAERAGADIDSAIDEKLGQLYDWVKGKLTDRPTGEASLDLLEEAPDGEKQKILVAQQLEDALGSDEKAGRELKALIAELDRLRPRGVTIEGLARAEDLYGEQVGTEVEGTLDSGDRVKGTGYATKVHQGGKNIGTKYKPGR